MIQHEHVKMMPEMWNEDRSPEQALWPCLTHTHTHFDSSAATGLLHSWHSLEHSVRGKKGKKKTAVVGPTTST